MSEISNRNGSGTSLPSSAAPEPTSTYTDTVFQRLEPREVEQFYKSYHFWLLQRRIDTLYTEASAVQQAITDNNTLMQQIPLSAIALASLAQLQASGVNDLNLLDRMLEQGETWLDHTMQLLEHCEQLDVIQGDYTQWCEHALEGAYDWIASMDAAESINHPENDAEPFAINDEQQATLHPATEEQLLQKLMDDEEATIKITPLNVLLSKTRETSLAASNRKITQPLNQTEPTSLEAPTRKITQPLEKIEPTSLETPNRKITQPLNQSEVLIQTETPITTTASTATEQIEPTAATEIIVQPATSLSQEDVEDDTAPTETMPTLTIVQINEASSAVDAERSADSNILSDTNNQIIEEPHREHSAQIDAMKLNTERSDEEFEESITQEVATSKAEDASKDADIYPVEDAIINTKSSAATATNMAVVNVNSQENKKTQLQKVRRRGFWRLLNRLLTLILRR